MINPIAPLGGGPVPPIADKVSKKVSEPLPGQPEPPARGPALSPAKENPLAPPPASPPVPMEVLGLPVVMAVTNSDPPAAIDSPGKFSKRPYAPMLLGHQQGLLQMGLALFKDKGKIVLANWLRLPELIEDPTVINKVGQPWDKIEKAYSVAGKDNPIFRTPQQVAALPAKTALSAPIADLGRPSVPNTPALSTPVPPAPAALIKAKARAAKPEPPTSGPRPGGGRLFNMALNPVI